MNDGWKIRFEVIGEGVWVPEGLPPPDGVRAFAPITPTALCSKTSAWMEDWQTEGLKAVQPNPAVGTVQYDNPNGTIDQR